MGSLQTSGGVTQQLVKARGLKTGCYWAGQILHILFPHLHVEQSSVLLGSELLLFSSIQEDYG